MRFDMVGWTRGWTLIVLLLVAPVWGRTVADEENLRSVLFTNYTVSVRPNDTTNLVVTLAPLALNELNIGTQQMSLTAIILMEWQDYRLAWEPASHAGIKVIRADLDTIWKPIIVVENEVDAVGAVGISSDYGIPIRVNNNGSVTWPVPVVTTTSCDVKIFLFPYDTQECFVTVTGWGDDDVTVSLTPGGMLLDYMAYNGEWEMLNTWTSVGYFYGTDGQFTRSSFYLTFRRRWQFYGLNLLLPLVLTSILMCGVFALPIESGEKMGFSLTVLLSYVVFLTWVTDNLPPISSDTSVLQVYLGIVLCLGGLAILLTLWVLHLYHRHPDRPMTSSMQTLVSKVLYPLWTGQYGACRKSSGVHVQETGEDGEGRKGQPDPGDLVLPLQDAFTSDKGGAPGTSLTPGTSLRPRLDDKDGDDHFTWQEVAAMFDWFFFLCFSATLCVVTLCIFPVLYSGYY